MAVSPEFRDHILDLLQGFDGMSVRSMFGGAGLFLDGAMFGLVHRSDVLYFRTDDGNRGAYEAAGMGPLVPFADGRMTMPFHQVPPDLFEDADEMCDWAREAWQAARRSKEKKAGGPAKRKRRRAKGKGTGG
jgi:DNA transformation protein and related proteins